MVDLADLAASLPTPAPSPALQSALDRIDEEFSKTPRLVVNCVPGGDGAFWWEIKAPHRFTVEAEIAKLQAAENVTRSEFLRPWRISRRGRVWWYAKGFTINTMITR